MRWEEGRKLLFTNVDVHVGQPRVNVTLRSSADNGVTWSKGVLVSGPGGYSDVQVSTTSSGARVAAVVYEHDSCSINVALVDPANA